MPKYIYKVIPYESFSQTGIKRFPSEIDWIHACEKGQVVYVINKFFKPEDNIIVLKLDISKLNENNFTIQYGNSSIDSQLFPRIYPDDNSLINIPYSCIKHIQYINSGSIRKLFIKIFGYNF
jgi:uncharacterized protein (DUF952 family)